MSRIVGACGQARERCRRLRRPATAGHGSHRAGRKCVLRIWRPHSRGDNPDQAGARCRSCLGFVYAGLEATTGISTGGGFIVACRSGRAPSETLLSVLPAHRSSNTPGSFPSAFSPVSLYGIRRASARDGSASPPLGYGPLEPGSAVLKGPACEPRPTEGAPCHRERGTGRGSERLMQIPSARPNAAGHISPSLLRAGLLVPPVRQNEKLALTRSVFSLPFICSRSEPPLFFLTIPFYQYTIHPT